VLYRCEFIAQRTLPIGFDEERRLPDYNGFQAQNTFMAGLRMTSGDIVECYLTPEAARRAARMNPRGGGHYWLYEIDALDMTGVSIGDNYANNPNMLALMAEGSVHPMLPVGAALPYTMRDSERMESALVQLRMEDNMQWRILRSNLPDS